MSEKQRVCCKLCNCIGVDGTVLCREHLDGYMCALRKLKSSTTYKRLEQEIQQQKGDDNGKSK